MLFLGLVAFTLAVPVDLKADEIPVQVVVAESVPANDAPKTAPVPVEEEKPKSEVAEVPAAVAAESEPAKEEEPKKVEEEAVVLVAVPVPEKEEEKSSKEPAKDVKPVEKTEEKSKDLETQSSVWGGWSSSPAVITGWPVASTYHGGWAHPRAYPSYYYPTSHYSAAHHYSTPSYWPGYVSSGWW